VPVKVKDAIKHVEAAGWTLARTAAAIAIPTDQA
jgi:hypothetical protein